MDCCRFIGRIDVDITEVEDSEERYSGRIWELFSEPFVW